MTHNSFPWFESIGDERFIATRETSGREEMEEHKVNYFQDRQSTRSQNLYTVANTEKIALASSSKELHQIVNTLSNRHPPRILPTIYPSADLTSIFIKHFTNKVEKHRANIASEHVISTFVTETTAATFSSFVKVSQLTVK